MEYRSSYERINNITDIDFISKKICKEYQFGKYKNYELIEIGYEDFNYILYSDNNKYFVKIFNTDRDDETCKRLINILIKSIDNGIPVPKLYKHKDKYIYEIKIKDTVLKLFVMEYIDGKNFWDLNKELDKYELEEVAQIAAKINSIDYGINETFYDEWTVTNLNQEYIKKKAYLTDKDNIIISKIVKEFNLIEFDKMKYAYVHGDIIKANLILDKDKKIHIIDFSAFNFLPRIIEISALLLGICLTDDKTSTINKMNLFLKYYDNHNSLYENEIEELPLVLKALAAMYIIQASYIRETSGDYLENDYWFEQGQKFLKMDINNKDIFIKKNVFDNGML